MTETQRLEAALLAASYISEAGRLGHLPDQRDTWLHAAIDALTPLVAYYQHNRLTEAGWLLNGMVNACREELSNK